MAVTRDSVGTSAVSTGAALSFAGPVVVTPGAGTMVLIAVVISVSTNSTATTCTVTYDGAAPTQIGTLTLLGTSTSRSAIGWWVALNPAKGSKTVVVTPGGGSTKTRVVAFVQAYSGADWTNTLNTIAKQSAASLTLSATTVAGGITCAATVNGAALSSPTQTQLYNNNVSVGGVGDTLLVQEAVGTGSNVSFSSTGTATTPTTQAVVLLPANPVSIDQEEFDDNSAGFELVPNSGTVTISGGVCSMSGANDSTTSGFRPGNGLTRNMLNGSVTIEVVQMAVTSGDSNDCYPFFIDAGFNTAWELGFIYGQSSGKVYTFYNITAGRAFDTGVTYDPVNHRWFRLRETAGTTYWEVAPDGNNWTILRSMATPWRLDGVCVNVWEVTYPSGTVTAPMIVDNYNLPPLPGSSLPAPVRRPNYGSLLQL